MRTPDGLNCTLGLFVILLASVSFAAEEKLQTGSLNLRGNPVEACVQAHREGYDQLYQYLAIHKSSDLRHQMRWWPVRDLSVSDQMLKDANRNVVQFKNLLKAAITYFEAPGYLRAFELKVKSEYPRLSYFVAYQGLRALMFPPAEINALDRLLKDNPDNIDDGPLDARRHGIWSALLARYLGPGIAFCMLALHEIDNAKVQDAEFFSGRSLHQTAATTMDFINNAKGVALGLSFKGSDSELLREVEASIWRGDFVVLKPNFEIVPMMDWLQRARAHRSP